MQNSNWAEAVADRVGERLRAFFETRRGDAARTSPAAPELIDAIAELTLRGGKRLRPCALYAGYRCVRGEDAEAATVDAGAALELLQSYLLIQDDWMDGDDERRGGPAVHAAFTKRSGDAHRGAVLAMLAADLASGFAWELIKDAPFAEGSLRRGLQAFGRMHFEVVCGQHLDLIEHSDVSLVHHLKSGSYTVRGPLELGALIAGATEGQLAALGRYGTPIGVAFQLRDDLLGTFGDPKKTGKSAGNDLRAGKYTSLVAEARGALPAGECGPLDAALGNREASEAQVEAARALLVESGAKARVQARLETLLGEAGAALEGSELDPAGLGLLGELTQRLASRDY